MQESSRGLVNDARNQQKSEALKGNTVYGSLEVKCAELHGRVVAFLEADASNDLLRRVQEQTRISLQVIIKALNCYDIDQLALSYNGGKDCLVLLALYLVGLYAHFSKHSSSFDHHSSTELTSSNSTSTLPLSSHTSHNNTSVFPQTLKSVYIIPPDPFPAVTAFVQTSSEQYHLSVARSTLPMKAAFAEYLSQDDQVKAIFVGTRRTDPHGANLTFFDKTDRGWPEFMRVHPVIDWHYTEIWGFIRHFSIPYCELYDLGYTSLGGTSDTHPNPALMDAGSSQSGTSKAAEVKYRPAYELEADDEERLGRDR